MTITQVPISTLKDVADGIAGLNSEAEYEGKIRGRCNVRTFGANPAGITGNLEAFVAAMASLPSAGGEIIVDAMYPLSDTLVVNKPITFTGTNGFGGASGMSFPANKTGIRFNNSQLSGTGTGADGSRVKDLFINCRDTQTTGHGIDIRAGDVSIDGVNIASFPECGIHIYGNMQYNDGNANMWRVRDTQIVVCGSHGFYAYGPDSNAGLALNVSIKSCGGWSFVDESKLGNTYVGCHSAGSALGDYKTDGTVSYSTLVGCYSEVEVGQSQSSYLGPTTIVGGITSSQGGTGVYSGVGTYYEGLNLNSTTMNSQSGRFHFRRDDVEIASLDENNLFQIFNGSFKCTQGGAWTRMEGITSGKYSDSTNSVDGYRFGNPNGTVGSIVINANGTTYATSSDYRLKENVQPMVGALEKLALLNPVTFKWKAGGTYGQGFIAHELQQVFPDAVNGQKDGDTMQSVDSSFIVATLVKAIQELREEVRGLRCSS